jgi:hypothetical protein
MLRVTFVLTALFALALVLAMGTLSAHAQNLPPPGQNCLGMTDEAAAMSRQYMWLQLPPGARERIETVRQWIQAQGDAGPPVPEGTIRLLNGEGYVLLYPCYPLLVPPNPPG